MALLGRFGPPVALMGVIFLLSAQPDLNSGLGTIDLVGRKLVHMLEYGLLWWLWLRALHFRHPWAALTLVAIYAASDEYHQTFVHGREGTVRDWVIDLAGVALAAILWRRARRRVRAQRAGEAV